MKFYLMVGLVVLVGYFSMRSCSNRMLGKKEVPHAAAAPAKPAETPPAAAASSPAGSPTPATPDASPGQRAAFPTVSAVVTFKCRPVPPATEFASLVATGSRAGDMAGLVVDEASNTVIVRGSPETVESLKAAIEALDIEGQEAFVDAWMLFVRGDRVRDFEASIEWGPGGILGGGSANLSGDGFGVTVPAGALRAHLQLQASNGVVEVVDRPQLRLSAGHKSEVSTGDEVPFPSTTQDNGVTRTSIEFKRVGLSFAVTPLFLTNGRVRLDVNAENGLLGATQKIGDIEVPSISRQTVKSAATLGYDDAMVIGGLESIRREKRFGLFGQSEKTQAGRLYVAVMLRSGVPKARPVIGPGLDLPLRPPGELGDPSPFDRSLLPPKGWNGSDLWPDGVEPKGLPLPISGPRSK